VRDRDGDELLGLPRQRAVGEHLLAERAKGGQDLGRELLALAVESLGRCRIKGVVHSILVMEARAG